MIYIGKEIPILDIKLATAGLKPLSPCALAELITDLGVLGVTAPISSVQIEAESFKSNNGSSESAIPSVKPSISLTNYNKRWVPPTWREEEVDRGADSSLRARHPKVFKIGAIIFNTANDLQEQAYHIAGLAADFDLYAFQKFFKSDIDTEHDSDSDLGIFQHRPIAEIADDLHEFINAIDRLTTRSRSYACDQFFSETDSDFKESRLAGNLALVYKHKDEGQSIEILKEKVKSLVGATCEMSDQLEQHVDRLVRILEYNAFVFRKLPAASLEYTGSQGDSLSEDLLNEARLLQARFNPLHESSLPSLLIQLKAIFLPESLFPKQFSSAI